MQFETGARKRRKKLKKPFLVLWVSSSQFPPGLRAKDPQGEWMRAQPRHHANHSHSVVAALHYTLRRTQHRCTFVYIRKKQDQYIRVCHTGLRYRDIDTCANVYVYYVGEWGAE